MNQFLEKYTDITAFILTLSVPLIITIVLKRRAQKKLRAVPAYFLVFGPCGVLAFIFFHLLENSYRAIENAINGSFQYSFRFYSLILFGLVLAYLGILFLKACFTKCLAEQTNNRSYFYKILLVLLITLPLIPITPIASVPAICCSISVLALPFVRRRSKKSSNQTSIKITSSPALTSP
jgi:H+/Cl- antiporter ClcA